ncbi:hypothetical protein CEXT_695481 [Caerostris extrusa]|uniref:Uncharacterized protein n=1 Tax=Caerostris extrusa TaxID=172846 RepID=A0AAV4QFY1_CAEEX|nr:hypothetical protein CEXT_695481 [Caerostris extrusa]
MSVPHTLSSSLSSSLSNNPLADQGRLPTGRYTLQLMNKIQEVYIVGTSFQILKFIQIQKSIVPPALIVPALPPSAECKSESSSKQSILNHNNVHHVLRGILLSTKNLFRQDKQLLVSVKLLMKRIRHIHPEYPD